MDKEEHNPEKNEWLKSLIWEWYWFPTQTKSFIQY